MIILACWTWPISIFVLVAVRDFIFLSIGSSCFVNIGNIVRSPASSNSAGSGRTDTC